MGDDFGFGFGGEDEGAAGGNEFGDDFGFGGFDDEAEDDSVVEDTPEETGEAGAAPEPQRRSSVPDVLDIAASSSGPSEVASSKRKASISATPAPMTAEQFEKQTATSQDKKAPWSTAPYFPKHSKKEETVRSAAATLSATVPKVIQVLSPGTETLRPESETDITGKVLRSIVFNSKMTMKGTFSIEIRDKPMNQGNSLAKETGLVADLRNFSPLVVEFSQQPTLEKGKDYYIHFRIESGAFKFQAIGGTGYWAYDMYNVDRARWMGSQLAFVFQCNFEDEMPTELGDLRTFASCRKTAIKAKGTLRESFKRNAERFVVVQSGQVSLYKEIGGSLGGTVIFSKIVDIIGSPTGSSRSVTLLTDKDSFALVFKAANTAGKVVRLIQERTGLSASLIGGAGAAAASK